MNVAIISHRRSGTHLTIDSLLNNFQAFQCNNGDYFTLRLEQPQLEMEQLEGLKNCVIKTHLLPNFRIYGIDGEEKKRLSGFFASVPKVYVYRNGLDVMVSMYYYMKKFDTQTQSLNFHQFLRTPLRNLEPLEDLTPPKLWSLHIESWFASDLLKENAIKLRYEDWIFNYERTLQELAGFLGLELPRKVKDVRVKGSPGEGKFAFLYGELMKKIKRAMGFKVTAVLPRKGQPGDYVHHFDSRDYDYFFKIAGDTMSKLGYDTNV